MGFQTCKDLKYKRLLEKTLVKIIVIGAGTAGLAFTAAANQLGLNATLLEKHPQIECLGGGITIYPHGVRALKTLGLNRAIQKIAHPIKNYYVYGNDKLLLQDTLNEFYDEVGDTLHSFLRYELLDILKEIIPHDKIHFGKKVSSIQASGEKTQIKTNDEEFYEADLVIDASGFHSYKNNWIPNNIQPTLLHYAYFGGVLSDDEQISLPELSSCTTFGEGWSSWILTLPHNKQWWYIAHDLNGEKLIKGEDKLTQIRKFCQKKSPHIDKLLWAKQTQHNFALEVYEYPKNGIFHHQNILKIGDASHTIGPTLGQGASSALMDALTLAKIISENLGSSIDSIIQQYIKRRTPIINEVYDLENASARLRILRDQQLINERSTKIGQSSVNKLLDPAKNVIKREIEYLNSFF